MKVVRHILLVLLSLLMVVPVLFVIIGATHDSAWAFELPFQFGFGTSFGDNYHSITSGSFNVWQALLVSFGSSFLTSSIAIIVLFLAAYALSKFNFKGKTLIYIIFFTLSFIPEPSYLIGQLDVINKMNLYSTFIGLVLPFIINLRVLIYLTESCKYISDSVINAARVEGANEFQILFKVAVVEVKDKILMGWFLIFVASWNNFLVPMIITSDSNLFNLPTFISSLADPLRYDLGAVFMSLLFSIIPVVLIFSICGHWIIKKDNN